MSSRDKDIFLNAIEITDLDTREAFIDKACRGDASLHSEVMSLLRSAEQSGGFLETPASVEQFNIDPQSTISDSIALRYLGPSGSENSLGRIDHFEIESVLGHGGTGVVFKAHDSKLDRNVAIKVLSPQIAIQSKARTRFIREAHAAAAIAHPNVIAIFGIDEYNGLPYLVMEYVEGKTLEQKIRDEGFVGLDPLLRIGAQIAQGLAAAHEQGLIHRDIKPSNVLLMRGSDRVKISDFGLARAIDDGEVTHTGLLSGTPQFMSPEQAAGQPLDHRTDLFSLGCVLYAMCVGQSPFKADSAIATIRLLCDKTPKAIQELNSSVPDRAVNLIGKLLEKDPGNRYQSARQIADELEADLHRLKDPAAVAMSVSSASGTASDTPYRNQQVGSTPSLSRTLKIVTAGVLVLLALAAVSEMAGWTSYLTPRAAEDIDPATGSVDTRTPLLDREQATSPEALNAMFFEKLTSDQYSWSEPINLGQPVNSEYEETYPRLSADGLLLVFSSNRPARLGEQINGDIWLASRASVDEPFTEVDNLGSAINTNRDEGHPSISGDGLILVFSRRIASGGGFELWTSTRASPDSPWSPATNMGPGFVGPHAHNAWANLSADGLTLDFVSHQPGGGPFIHMRSVRSSTDEPWPDGEPFDLLAEIPDNTFISYMTVSGNDLAAVYNLSHGRMLFVREYVGGNWVGVSAPDDILHPDGISQNGNAHNRHISADGSTMVYGANWFGYCIGGRDIWMVERVRRLSD